MEERGGAASEEMSKRYRGDNQWRHWGLLCVWTRSQSSLGEIMSIRGQQERTFFASSRGRRSSGDVHKSFCVGLQKHWKPPPSASSWFLFWQPSSGKVFVFTLLPQPGDKVSRFLDRVGVFILPPLRLTAPSWTQRRWFRGCWVSRRWVEFHRSSIPSSSGQLRFWTVTSVVVVVAVHGAEPELQEWWRRWVSQSSVLPEWGKLL